jgi:hypothetical protein
MEPPVAADV